MKRAYIRNNWENKELVAVNKVGGMFAFSSCGPKWKLWVQWVLAQTESRLLGPL